MRTQRLAVARIGSRPRPPHRRLEVQADNTRRTASASRRHRVASCQIASCASHSLPVVSNDERLQFGWRVRKHLRRLEGSDAHLPSLRCEPAVLSLASKARCTTPAAYHDAVVGQTACSPRAGHRHHRHSRYRPMSNHTTSANFKALAMGPIKF